MLRLLTLCLLWASSALAQFYPQPDRPGPWVTATKGSVWPKPQQQTSGDNVFILFPETFTFNLNAAAEGCPHVASSLPRFLARAFPATPVRPNPTLKAATKQQFELSSVDVILTDAAGCEEMPYMGMDESYEIELSASAGSTITARTVWGVLRGLESFSQLVYWERATATFHVEETTLTDFPRFEHRGFMVDTSRHYLRMQVLLDILDIMEMNKLNVFHWHIVDDQAFPYESLAFPELSAKGAYDSETHLYTTADVQTILNSATARGIRVVPEFDTPGHTQSWELGQPGLLAECYEDDEPNGFYGPMDPTKESTFTFLSAFFDETSLVFPDKYFHVGGDEVYTDCWESNPHINEVMAQWNISGQYLLLESYHIQRVLTILENVADPKIPVVWQEVFDNGDEISASTVVHVWKSESGAWRQELERVVKAGQPALLSAPWYLNYIDYGSDWVPFYQSDPHDFNATAEEKGRVIGGEACIWGEYVNSVNVIPRAWPRGSAVAERLWSAATVTDIKAAGNRMEEHTCRMQARGYPVQPVVGSGYCNIEYHPDSIRRFH